MGLGLKNLFLQILTNNRKEKEKDDDDKQIKENKIIILPTKNFFLLYYLLIADITPFILPLSSLCIFENYFSLVVCMGFYQFLNYKQLEFVIMRNRF